jgi:hypothetical protein
MPELQLTIFTEQDFTDNSIVKYLSENVQFSSKDYSEFILNKVLWNDLAETLIRFISTYDNGFLKPDKCNAYEPINRSFNEHELAGPISWLSQPGGAFYFKKVKKDKIEGRIENHRFGPIWESGSGNRLLKPSVSEPPYKGEVTLFFDETLVQKRGVFFWKEFIYQLCKSINAMVGYLSFVDEQSCQKNEVGMVVLSDRASEVFDFKYLPIR